MTLEEVLRFVEAKEAGKRSASRLMSEPQSSADAMRSSYKKNPPDGYKVDPNDICSYCGKTGHGKRMSSRIRSKKCPAFIHTCRHCDREHHFDNMCRSRSKPKDVLNVDREGAIFDSICASSSISQQHDGRTLSLDHHMYNEICDQWSKQTSQSQPFIKLQTTVHSEDYAALGFKVKISPRTASLPAMADTGCQSCLAGVNILHPLGLTEDDLIPVTMKMHAANNNRITILGATVLRFSGKSETDEIINTRQIVYITDSCSKIFLSREACVTLGIISSSFPTIGEATNGLDDGAPCCCPQRELPPPLPEKLPYTATAANHGKLRNFLLEHYKSSTFNTCEHQLLPMMEGPPMRLIINPTAEPVAVHTPIPVPIHWREEVKAALDQDVRLGVIEQVPVGEPVTWCHRMVICPKKNGKPRRTVDFQRPLNTHATRETHHTQSPFHQARSVQHGKKKTVFDAWNGYHSVPLHKDDRHYTTFITPWGRYRYCTAPQGYIASGDGYSRRYDEIVAHIPRKTKCIDDTLLWSNSIEDSFFQAAQWLDGGGRNGITLNPEKFVFCEDEVEFAGFRISLNNVSPCQRYLQAIKDFPTPKNITDVRSWFGLLNQVSYAFSMAKRLQPLRQLLKPDQKFEWSDPINNLFEESKDVIISEIDKGVRIFDKNKPTCLATDWSKDGIGFWLLQKHCNCEKLAPFCCRDGWQITIVGSRFTHAAESRYAPIEGESLAVADALDKARFFVLGCTNLIVAVDHKPLLKILGDHSLEDISNNRLRNLKEKTLRYKFHILHVPGAKHKAADAMSRYPSGHKQPEMLELPDDIASLNVKHFFLSKIRQTDEADEDGCIDRDIKESTVCALNSLSAVTWQKVRVATSSDVDMNLVLDTIESGIPKYRHEMAQSIREYHQFRDELYSVDGVVIYKDRVVIPPSLRNEVLLALHAAHQGVTSMTSRAEASVFWPGITSAIATTRARCEHCNRIAPSQPNAPPFQPVLPMYPFQCICADFFTYKGVFYLCIVDRYSNWPIIEKTTGGASGLIDSLRRTFVTYGIPDELASDGGSEFVSGDTQKFLKSWGVHHRLSSVAFPHSNCRAEIGVKSMKRLIADNSGHRGQLDTDARQRAVLQYRNTPDADTKLSPAMCLFGRPIKDFIPILPGRYKPHDTWRQTLAAREEALRNRHMKTHERWSEHTKQLPPLRVGDFVRIQNQIGHHPKKWDKTGTVIEVRQFNQYVVRVDGSGRVTLRNRKFLRKYAPVVPRQPHHTINNDLNYMQQPTKIVSPSPRTIDDIPDSHTADMTPHTPIVHKQTRPSDLTLSQTSPSAPSTPSQQVRKQLPTMSTLPRIPSPQLSPPPDHSRPSEPATPSQTVPPPPDVELLLATPPGRPKRSARPPAWHKDYQMDQ